MLSDPQGFTHTLPNLTFQQPPHLVNEIFGSMSGRYVLPVQWARPEAGLRGESQPGPPGNETLDIGAELSDDKQRLLLHIVNWGTQARNVTLQMSGISVSGPSSPDGASQKVTAVTQQMQGAAACRIGPQLQLKTDGGGSRPACINTPAQPMRYAVVHGRVELLCEQSLAEEAPSSAARAAISYRFSGLSIPAATFFAAEIQLTTL